MSEGFVWSLSYLLSLFSYFSPLSIFAGYIAHPSLTPFKDGGKFFVFQLPLFHLVSPCLTTYSLILIYVGAIHLVNKSRLPDHLSNVGRTTAHSKHILVESKG